MSNETVEATPEVVVNESVGTEESDLNQGNISFDDLDALTETRDSKELMNEAKDFLEEGSEDTAKAEEKQSGYKAKDKRKEEIETKEEAEEGTQVETDPAEEIKYKVGSFKDITQDIAEDTIFSHKVDGEEVEVSLKDLMGNYSGKVPYDKKFNELNISKKEYETSKQEYDKEKEYINNYINEFANKMKDGKAIEALGFLSEFAGMKPYEFKQQLLQSLAPEIDRRRQLTQDQLSNEQLNEENKYLQQKGIQDKQEAENQAAIREMEKQIFDLQQQYKISDGDFDQAYNELKETNLKDNLHPELVVNYLRHKEAFTRADTVLEEVQPSLTSNEYVVEAVEKIIFDNPEFTDEKIKEIVQDIYGKEHKKASKAVSKKMQTKSEEQPEGTQRDLEDIVNWDDM